MGAPAWFKFDCGNCTAPNVMTYATTPRINEDRVEKVSDNGGIRVWRCRCTECGHSTMFNEHIDGRKETV
jgi:ribosomal protein S27AE